MKNLSSIIILILLSAGLSAQELTLKGSVVDKNTGEPLVGATVKDVTSNTEVITDFDGNFALQVSKADFKQLTISYISYEEIKLNRVIIKDNEKPTLNIKLKRAGTSSSKKNFLASDSKSDSGA